MKFACLGYLKDVANHLAFDLACVQTPAPLPSVKIGEGAPSPTLTEGRGSLYTGYFWFRFLSLSSLSSSFYTMKSANLTLSPHFWKSLGAYHLHGKSGNCDWKIQWFAPFRLKRFRILGDAILLLFFNLFCWFGYFIHCSGSFSHHVKFYSFIFCTRFFTRVVCVIGKHPLNNKCTAILTYIVNDK